MYLPTVISLYNVSLDTAVKLHRCIKKNLVELLSRKIRKVLLVESVFHHNLQIHSDRLRCIQLLPSNALLTTIAIVAFFITLSFIKDISAPVSSNVLWHIYLGMFCFLHCVPLIACLMTFYIVTFIIASYYLLNVSVVI